MKFLKCILSFSLKIFLDSLSVIFSGSRFRRKTFPVESFDKNISIKMLNLHTNTSVRNSYAAPIDTILTQQQNATKAWDMFTFVRFTSVKCVMKTSTASIKFERKMLQSNVLLKGNFTNNKFENNVSHFLMKCWTTDNVGMKYLTSSLKRSWGRNAHN